MKKNKNSGLEKILISGGSSCPCNKKHPHEDIAGHVGLVIFISLLFLLGVFLFFISEPGTTTTGYAVVDFSDINMGLGERVENFINAFTDLENREEFLFILYVSWILIIGVTSLYFVERDMKK